MDNDATITPFNLDPAFLPVRRFSEPSTSITRASSGRSSVSLRLPYLRQLDIGVDMAPRHQKVPLLTLKLSSNSFLDSSLYDDRADEPLYVVKTVGPLTTLQRSDAWEGLVQASGIRWPTTVPIKGKGKDLDSVSVQIAGGRWRDAVDLLKPASLLQAHKFTIPSFSHNLKWKRTGTSYHCTCATVKGPIATYESAGPSSPAQLKMFETFRDKNDDHKMAAHNGVSTHLLDYIITTLLLVVTDVHEWTTLNGPDAQWRYGDPLCSRTRLPLTATLAGSPPDSAPTERWPQRAFGEPPYPLNSPRSLSPSISDVASYTSYSTWDPPKPSAESAFFSSTTSLALSHTFADPRTRYYDPNAPPVPEIPLQYRSPSSDGSIGHATPGSQTGQEPSAAPVHSLERHLLDHTWPRSKSTPPQTLPSAPEPLPESPSWKPSHTYEPSRGSSIMSAKSRRLPRPPQSASTTTSAREKRASQYIARTLPPAPSGPSSSVPAVEAQQVRRQEQLEKQVDELASWVHTLTGERHIPSVQAVMFEVPPPAYNDHNFTHSNERSLSH